MARRSRVAELLLEEIREELAQEAKRNRQITVARLIWLILLFLPLFVGVTVFIPLPLIYLHPMFGLICILATYSVKPFSQRLWATLLRMLVFALLYAIVALLGIYILNEFVDPTEFGLLGIAYNIPLWATFFCGVAYYLIMIVIEIIKHILNARRRAYERHLQMKREIAEKKKRASLSQN